jgi:hypothetical protein
MRVNSKSPENEAYILQGVEFMWITKHAKITLNILMIISI